MERLEYFELREPVKVTSIFLVESYSQMFIELETKIVDVIGEGLLVFYLLLA